MERRIDFNKISNCLINDFFVEVVNQALEIGYKNLGLTPQTGDIFMDKDIFKKFEYLDQNKILEGYYFYTNFILIT